MFMCDLKCARLFVRAYFFFFSFFMLTKLISKLMKCICCYTKTLGISFPDFSGTTLQQYYSQTWTNP